MVPVIEAHDLSKAYGDVQGVDHVTFLVEKGDLFSHPGPVKLFTVKTDVGMVGCGMFNIAAPVSFSSPAAKVRPSPGLSITDSDGILAGIVREASRSAFGRGIRTGTPTETNNTLFPVIKSLSFFP